MSDAPRPTEGRIDISVPTNYVQTDESVWDDLEELLFRGFLMSHADVLGQHFVFKTLNHLELKFMELMRTGPSSSADSRSAFRASFIAHSVVMANGTNVLFDRPKNLTRLVKMFARMPAKQQDLIVENIAALSGRAARAYPLAEVYVHENRSRFRWMQYKGTQLCSSSVTGIAGTEHLGLNHSQLTWSALNHILDRNDEMEREWSNAKFVGSCMAGKGIRSVDERDKMRHERERTEREDKKMSVLRAYLNRTVGGPSVPSEMVSLPDGRMAEVAGRFRADSAQDLAKQLTAALNDEKDAHDLAVESHIRKVQGRAEDIEREKRAMAGSIVLSGSESSSRSITKGEADTRMRRIRESILETRLRVVPDSEASDAGSDGGH